MIVRLEGGPATDYETHLIGADEPPDYILVLPLPEGQALDYAVVGIGFDDHWPGQLRYAWHEDLKTEVAPDRWEDLSVYVYVPEGAADPPPA